MPNSRTKSKMLGTSGEDWAATAYKNLGYKIIGRNVKIIGYKQLGEIDLIAVKKKELVFVEVKTRTSSKFMPSIEAFGWRQRQRLMKAVKAFWAAHPEFGNYDLRVDVAIIQPDLDGNIQSANIIEDAIQDLS